MRIRGQKGVKNHVVVTPFIENHREIDQNRVAVTRCRRYAALKMWKIRFL